MLVITQIVLALLLLTAIYFIIRKIVNSPITHKYAKLQNEKFMKDYSLEQEE